MGELENYLYFVRYVQVVVVQYIVVLGVFYFGIKVLCVSIVRLVMRLWSLK